MTQWQQVKQAATDSLHDVTHSLSPGTIIDATGKSIKKVRDDIAPRKKPKKRQQSARQLLQPAGEEAFVLPVGTTITLPQEAGGSQFVTTTKSTIKKAA